MSVRRSGLALQTMAAAQRAQRGPAVDLFPPFAREPVRAFRQCRSTRCDGQGFVRLASGRVPIGPRRGVRSDKGIPWVLADAEATFPRIGSSAA